MTRVYFVRYAQPEYDWKEDRTRPLTEAGKKDSVIILGFLDERLREREKGLDGNNHGMFRKRWADHNYYE